MSDETIRVYRGLHAGHPAIAAARNGVVIPGDVNGTVTPEEHNFGGVSDRSPYTSWSRSYDEAARFASAHGPGGVLLTCAFTSFEEDPPSGANWTWVRSIDFFDEEEILLRGVRIGVEVIK